VSDAVFLPDEVFGDGDRSPHSIMISGVELR